MRGVNGTRLNTLFVDCEGWGWFECHGCAAEFYADAAGRRGVWRRVGFASRSCCRKPRAVLAEARLPGATLCRPFRAQED